MSASTNADEVHPIPLGATPHQPMISRYFPSLYTPRPSAPPTTTVDPARTTAGYTCTLPPPPQHTDLRLLFNNINSIQSWSPAVLGVTIEKYLALSPDILGLAETQKNWTRHESTFEPIRRTANHLLGHSATRLVTSHCPEPAIGYKIHQPGGVAQLVLRKVTGRVQNRGQDSMGRWAWQDLRLDGTNSLVVITAYRVNPAGTAIGHTTAYMQQVRALTKAKRGGPNPNPRKMFLTDLALFLTSLRQAGKTYILMMDANTRPTSSELLGFMQDHDLTDLMQNFLPQQRPPTYRRGQHQIDFILGSSSLLPYITAAYIMDFGLGPTSDHCMLVVDLNMTALIAQDSLTNLDPTSPGHRQLRSTDVKAVTRYLDSVNHQVMLHNIHARVLNLTQRCSRTNKCTSHDKRQFQHLSAQMSDILLKAETRCKPKLTRGSCPWSPLLVSAGHTVHAAEQELSRLTHHGPPQTPGQSPQTAIRQAKNHLAIARKLLTMARQKAQTLRDTFLELRAADEADRLNQPKATILQEILKRERLSRIYRLLSSKVSGKIFTQLDQVLVPNDPTDPSNSTWKSLMECEPLWEALLLQGKEHFGQASATPFATGPLAELMGPFAQNSTTEDILNGTFDSSHLDTFVETKDLLHALRYADPAHPPELDCLLTLKDLRDAYKHISESTASSPSGIHYGHYRTLLRDNNLFDTYGLMTIFAFQWGVVPKRWLSAVQILLEKDPGNPRITRLRRIQLLESDMNTGFKVIWGHRLLNKATEMGLISDWQFGIRKGRMCISAVLLKCLSYDCIRLQRSTAVVLDNDMRACYDRIVPSQATLTTRRVGLAPRTASTMLEILANTKFHVRTAYGVSPHSFQNEPTSMILGLLQGSAAVGAVWALIWSILFKCLESLPQPRFTSPRPDVYSSRHGEGFVDDTTLWEVDPNASTQTVVTRMTTKAQRWERLIWSSGGALNLDKCYVYLLEWTYSKTGIARLKPLKDMPYDVSLTAGNSPAPPVPIRTVEPHQGTRTLGVRLAPDGNDHDEYTFRLTQAQALKHRLSSAHLTREQANIGFQSLWRPAIGYPLPITSFTPKQCQKIQSQYMPQFSAQMGLNRHTPNAIKYGPLRYGGMNLPSIWAEQGAGHVKLALSHLRKNDDVGKLLSIMLDGLQLHAGVPWPILSRQGTAQCAYIPQTWATHLWQFLDSIEVTLHRENPPLLHRQRERDSFIMEEISHLPGIRNADLQLAQRCRLFLQVTTLADITNSDGTHIELWALGGIRSTHRTPLLHYPPQPRPPNSSFKSFATFLHRVYTHGDSPVLRNPLGHWFRGRMAQHWTTTYDPRHRIVSISQGTWTKKFSRRSRKKYIFSSSTPNASISRAAIPISGEIVGGHFEATAINKCSIIPIPPSLLPENSLLPMLRGVTLHCDPADIATAIWRGDAALGTDGSVQAGQGTYGFALAIKNQQTQHTLAVDAHGLMPDLAEHITMDSHRPEGAALYAGLTWIKTLLLAHPRPHASPPPTRPVHIFLDNKSVTQDAQHTMQDNTPVFAYLRPDYDITQGIQMLLASLPISTTICWVKSHQDDDTPFAELPLDARLNVIADKACTFAHTADVMTTGRFPEHVPGTHASLHYQGRTITKHAEKYVREKTHANALIEYSRDRSNNRLRDCTAKWSDQTFHNIDWQAFESRLKSLSPTQRLRITKFVHDWTPTLHHNSKFDNKIDNRCFVPECRQLWEDSNHIFRCKGLKRSRTRTIGLSTIRSDFAKLHTPPDMCNAILQALRKWLLQTPITPPSWPTEDITPLRAAILRAFTAQTTIGWDQFFRGRLTKYWRRPLKLYYQERDARPTPALWMSKCIDTMWTFYSSMWDQRNEDLFGGTKEEVRAKALDATRNTVRKIYTATQGRVNSRQTRILHRLPIADILTWTKTHLDAYLATAEIFLEQNVDPA